MSTMIRFFKRQQVSESAPRLRFFMFGLLVIGSHETQAESYQVSASRLAEYGLTQQQLQNHPQETYAYAHGQFPHPVTYHLPPQKPLSALAKLGKVLFYDPKLSATGKQSCASCHDPHNAYEPPEAMQDVMYGGLNMHSAGYRPPPSLRYLYRQTAFSIGPDIGEDDNVTNQLSAPPAGTQRAVKTANSTASSAANIVPQGGLFWDGRADSLQIQTTGPLFNPVEMANAPQASRLIAYLKNPRYRPQFTQLFGANVYGNSHLLLAEMEDAIARYEIEDSAAFYPFSSKYDAWLQGKATLTAQEMRGYLAFNDVNKGDCAACHLSQPSKDGQPPIFTDQQYEALGVPRNSRIPANANPNWYDLGICGPFRQDMTGQSSYCGMFLTPTLRNVARRHVFMHNSAFHTLQQVLDFYNFRDTNPEKIYPTVAGKVQKFNDLPKAYWENVDRTDPPFNRKLGEAAAMSAQDEADIIAFLHTLNDGYAPAGS